MQTFWWNTLWNFSRVSVLPNGAGITQGFGNCTAERVNSPDTTRDQALQLRLQHHLLGLHNVKKKALNALKCYVFPCAVEWANSTRGPSTTRGPRLANNSGAKSTRGPTQLGHCLAFKCIECIDMLLDAMLCPPQLFRHQPRLFSHQLGLFSH